MTLTANVGPRNFELCALQACNVSADMLHPPYDTPYFETSIKKRKGWTRNDIDGPLEGENGR